MSLFACRGEGGSHSSKEKKKKKKGRGGNQPGWALKEKGDITIFHRELGEFFTFGKKKKRRGRLENRSKRKKTSESPTRAFLLFPEEKRKGQHEK